MHGVIKRKMIAGTDSYREEYLSEVQDLMESKTENNFYTTDGPKLNLWKEHDLFVIGPMKHGFSRHSLLGEGQCLGKGYCNTTLVKMYRTNNRNTMTEPVLLFDSNATGTGRVFGEIWRVPTKTLFRLDYYEEQGTVMRRIKIPIRLSIGKSDDQFRIQPCWVYVGHTDWWKKRMDQLVLCDINIPNDRAKKPYFIYKKTYETEWLNKYGKD
jgi:gamma-glutamylcyclotransferase (GGCT)/AIG2-like uncharacterized protein YtfP